MSISDVQLARLMLGQWRPAPGTYTAPCGIAEWDGHTATCRLNGTAPDPAAMLLYPALQLHQVHAAGSPPSAPTEPTIAALVANYSAATAPFAASSIPESAFTVRLHQGCRLCEWWKEQDRNGCGRCDSPACACTKRLLWLISETCPAKKWPA